ncbi:retrotransposon polyprotein [Penicillium sp. DV-2018c]|nr:retrotransposon polyprotein [Penicillium sp. DV-2018c]
MSGRAFLQSIELAHQLTTYHSQEERPHQDLFVAEVEQELQQVCTQEPVCELPRHQPIPLDWALDRRVLARDIRTFRRLFTRFFETSRNVPNQVTTPLAAVTSSKEVPDPVTTRTPSFTEYRETPRIASQTSSEVASPLSPVTKLELGVRQLSVNHDDVSTMSSTTIPDWMRTIPRDTPLSSLPNENQVVYSKNQYKRDAVYILQLVQEIQEGRFRDAEAAGLISESDYLNARSAVFCLDSGRRQELLTKVQAVIGDGTHAAANTQTLRRFLEPFREGPTHDADPPENAPAEDNLAEDPPAGSSLTRPNTVAVTPLMPKTDKTRGGNPSDPDSSSSDSGDSPSRPRRRPRHMSSDRYHLPTATTQSVRKLKPEDVQLFDPKTVSVTSFTKRLRQMSRLYGEQSVLNVVPLCLRGDARDWYTHLSDETTDAMQESMQVCIQKLERRFKKNPFEARTEADRLKFRYAKEKELGLREYVEKKIMLLREANITDEQEIVIRVWEKLDPVLMNVVRPEGKSLDSFTDRVFLQEVPARLAWNQNNRTSTTTSARRTHPPTSTDAKEESRRESDPGGAQEKTPRVGVRDCRHCGGPHFDFDCPTRKPAVKAFLVTGDAD